MDPIPPGPRALPDGDRGVRPRRRGAPGVAPEGKGGRWPTWPDHEDDSPGATGPALLAPERRGAELQPRADLPSGVADGCPRGEGAPAGHAEASRGAGLRRDLVARAPAPGRAPLPPCPRGAAPGSAARDAGGPGVGRGRGGRRPRPSAPGGALGAHPRPGGLRLLRGQERPEVPPGGVLRVRGRLGPVRGPPTSPAGRGVGAGGRHGPHRANHPPRAPGRALHVGHQPLVAGRRPQELHGLGLRPPGRAGGRPGRGPRGPARIPDHHPRGWVVGGRPRPGRAGCGRSGRARRPPEGRHPRSRVAAT